MKHWHHLCHARDSAQPDGFHQALSWWPRSRNVSCTKTRRLREPKGAYRACADLLHHRISLFLLFPLKSVKEQERRVSQPPSVSLQDQTCSPTILLSPVIFSHICQPFRGLPTFQFPNARTGLSFKSSLERSTENRGRGHIDLGVEDGTVCNRSTEFHWLFPSWVNTSRNLCSLVFMYS